MPFQGLYEIDVKLYILFEHSLYLYSCNNHVKDTKICGSLPFPVKSVDIFIFMRLIYCKSTIDYCKNITSLYTLRVY